MQYIKKILFGLMIIVSIATPYGVLAQDVKESKDNNEIIQPEASETGDDDLVYEEESQKPN